MRHPGLGLLSSSACRWAVTSLVVGLTAVGCAAPHANVSLSGEAVPINVAFGKPTAILRSRQVTLVPVPGLGVLPVATVSSPSQPVVVQPEQHQPSVSLPPPPSICPALTPSTTPASAAGPDVQGVPPTKTVAIRFSGQITSGGKGMHVFGFGRQSVSNTYTLPSGQSRFDVTLTILGESTTFSYVVQPSDNSVPPAAGSTGEVALRSVTGSGGLGYEAKFQPSVPLEVLPLPAEEGVTWSAKDADASSETTATLSGTVGHDVRVNACGTALDTWKVSDQLVTQSTGENIQTSLTTFFATQFGGLPVGQSETYKGTAGGTSVSGTFSWYVDANPGPAGS